MKFTARQFITRAQCLCAWFRQRLVQIIRVERPVGNAYFGEAATAYLSKRMRQPHWELEQRVVEEIISQFPDGLRVLDLPFGTGRFVPAYVKKKMVVFGLDSSTDMLAVAQRQLGENLAQCHLCIGDARQLPYADKSFDLVVCLRFLSHVLSIRDATTVLREIDRVAQSKAILQFRIRRDDVSRVRRPFPFEPMGDRLPSHAVIELLSDTGFNVQRLVRLDQRRTYYRAVFLCDIQ